MRQPRLDAVASAEAYDRPLPTSRSEVLLPDPLSARSRSSSASVTAIGSLAIVSGAWHLGHRPALFPGLGGALGVGLVAEPEIGAGPRTPLVRQRYGRLEVGQRQARHLRLKVRAQALVGNQLAHRVQTEPARPYWEQAVGRHRTQLVHELGSTQRRATGWRRQARTDEHQPSDLDVQ